MSHSDSVGWGGGGHNCGYEDWNIIVVICVTDNL